MRHYFKLCGTCKFMHECEKKDYLERSEKLLNIEVELETCIDHKKRMTGKYVLDNLNGHRNLYVYSNIIDFTDNALEMAEGNEIHCYMSQWAVYNLWKDSEKIPNLISLHDTDPIRLGGEANIDTGITFNLPNGSDLIVWDKNKLPYGTPSINKAKIIDVL